MPIESAPTALQRSLAAHDASVFDGGIAGPVCFPETTEEVQAIMRIAEQHGSAVVPRGAGTGLAGGAIPLGRPIVVSTGRMNKVLSVDTNNRIAWVQPGVINLDLSKKLQPKGFHFAPDPSSQQVCTLGGNVANNSGGPHCLAYGVTDAHVVSLEVVLPDGQVAVLGGAEDETPASTFAARSSAARARSGSPPRSGSASHPTPRPCAPCCCRSQRSATPLRPSATSSPPASYPLRLR